MSLFRYPGGKSKLQGKILNKIVDVKQGTMEYREPFFGGGSIGIKLLRELSFGFKSVWLNDFDAGIACLWTAVIKHPEELKLQVNAFKPSVEQFDWLVGQLLNPPDNFRDKFDVINHGFKKLAVHQISYSGLGTKSGGPLGGRDQKSAYKIDCRWSPKYICKKIDEAHGILTQFNIRYNECTKLDFEAVIKDKEQASVIYADPPYYVKGNVLYQHGFTERDHVRLAKVLKDTSNNWVLSYDKCDPIMNLYEGCDVEEIGDVMYSITALKDKDTGERLSRSKTELLITKKNKAG